MAQAEALAHQPLDTIACDGVGGALARDRQTESRMPEIVRTCQYRKSTVGGADRAFEYPTEFLCVAEAACAAKVSALYSIGQSLTDTTGPAAARADASTPCAHQSCACVRESRACAYAVDYWVERSVSSHCSGLKAAGEKGCNIITDQAFVNERRMIALRMLRSTAVFCAEKAGA